MDAILAQASPANPLVELPLVGPLVGLLDDLALDLGLPYWFRTFVELGLAALAAFICLRLLLHRLLPWAGRAFVGPALRLIEAVRMVGLVPDLAVSRALRSRGRRPPGVVYYYGAAVMALGDAMQHFARSALAGLSVLRKVPPLAMAIALVLAFLLWNRDQCVMAPAAQCVSPVTHWMSSFDAGE